MTRYLTCPRCGRDWDERVETGPAPFIETWLVCHECEIRLRVNCNFETELDTEVLNRNEVWVSGCEVVR